MSQECLLIVEDDPGLRSQMRSCFENLDVLVAGNLREAGVVLDDQQTLLAHLFSPPIAREVRADARRPPLPSASFVDSEGSLRLQSI